MVPHQRPREFGRRGGRKKIRFRGQEGVAMNHCHPETTQQLELGAHRQQGISAQDSALNIPPWIEGNC